MARTPSCLTNKMFALALLLLPFSSAVSVVGKTDLIDGHFKYKVDFKSGQVSNDERDCRLHLGTG